MHDLEPTLTRSGYNVKALSELLGVRQPEVRAFLRGQLPPGRTAELHHQLLAAGLPLGEASGRSRTARQRAKRIRGYAWQPMWAREEFVGYLQRMWAYLQIIWVKAAFYLEPMWAESRDVCGSEGLRLGAATGKRRKTS